MNQEGNNSVEYHRIEEVPHLEVGHQLLINGKVLTLAATSEQTDQEEAILEELVGTSYPTSWRFGFQCLGPRGFSRKGMWYRSPWLGGRS